MTAATAAPRLVKPKLDNLTLARKEGWQAFCEAPKPVCPEILTKRQIRNLSDSAADTYNDRRLEWHNNLGPFKTRQIEELHDQLWDIMNSRQGRNSASTFGAIAIDGYPAIGKTTAAEEFAKQFHQHCIQKFGPYTEHGHERWPILRIGMRGNTSMKDFNTALCDFYAHPGQNRGSTEVLGQRALDLVVSCGTKLLIIDDLHFLHWQSHGGVELSHHFKYIADNFPLTLLSIGIGLGQRGVLLDGTTYDDEVLNQTTRWTTTLELTPHRIKTQQERREWRGLLKTIEQRLILGNKRQGMLAEDLADYLYERSGGHIGSLMELVRIGCARATRTGEETLNQKLLDRIKIDSAAEKARKELAAAFRTRKLFTRPVQ
jgi:hypothetical protein